MAGALTLDNLRVGTYGPLQRSVPPNIVAVAGVIGYGPPAHC
jgi:hypothetical protein